MALHPPFLALFIYYMKWNGRSYRPPGYGIKVYPTKQDSIADLLKPLGEKTRKGNVWIPVLNQPINVLKDGGTPTPDVTPSQTPTGTPTNTPTPTPSSTVPSPSASPTGTPTPTPTPSTAPPASVSYITQHSTLTNSNTYTFSTNFVDTGLAVVTISGKCPAGSDVSSVTIAGVTATRRLGVQISDSLWGGIYTAVLTGTTGDIVVNTTTTFRDMTVGVWRVNNYLSATPIWNIQSSSTVNPASETRTASAGSVGILVISNLSNVSILWTNATEDFEYYNGDAGDPRDTSGASFATTLGGSRTITATGSGAGWLYQGIGIR